MPKTSLTGAEVNGSMMTVMLTLDLGNNVWLLGVVDNGILKMVKIRITGPTTSIWLDTRVDAEYDSSCAFQPTFLEACFTAADRLGRDAFPVASAAWGIMPDTKLTAAAINSGMPLPTKLSRYLGNKVWLLGVVDGGILKMVKIWARTPTESEWLGSRINFDYDPSCAIETTFGEACYAGGIGLTKETFPVSFRATEPPIFWSILPQTSLTSSEVNDVTPLPVKLTRDLGNNVWLIGVMDGGILRMAKIKVLGQSTSELLGTRSDAHFDPRCAIQATFGEIGRAHV